MPDASSRTQEQAQRLAKRLTLKSVTTVTAADIDSCYLSLVVRKSEAQVPGFTIRLAASGGTVVATDENQLRRAVDELIKLLKKENDEVLLPVPSVITSYPVVP